MAHLTLDEIAKRAGVSRTTASRVMNNRPHVRPELRERVQAVIEETGYSPHPVARSLAFQRSRIIGLVLPRRANALFADPFFSFLIQGIAEACNQCDYTLFLFLCQTKADEDKIYSRASSRGWLDGIVVQVGQVEDQLISKLLQANIPLVVAGRPASVSGASYVDVDNVAGGYEATAHLARLGRRRIATITGALNTTTGLDRQEGYQKAIQAYGLAADQALVVEGDYSEAGGYRAMLCLLSQKPDAIFVASDTMALGALRAIHEAGLSVPGDVAVVGYDDLPPAVMADPPLTTVRQPVGSAGAKTVEILFDIIEHGAEPPHQVILDTELVIRGSCGAFLAG